MADPPKAERVILLVEDDQRDALLVKSAFQRAGLNHKIHLVARGLDAIAYLSEDPPYSDRTRFPLPAMLLLDIGLPDTDGFYVLDWIRRHPTLGKLCVVMLTGSDDTRDAYVAYQLGVNSFLVKPLDFWNAAELSRSLERLLTDVPSDPPS